MRCPKCHTDTPSTALQCPGCNSLTPKGRVAEQQAAETKKKLQAEKRKNKKHFVWTANQQSMSWKSVDWKSWRSIPWLRLIPKWLPWAVVFLVFSVASFFTYQYVYSSSPELETANAKVAMGVMNQVRSLPSKKSGMTLDQCMMDEIKKSKESGQLVSYSGWAIKSQSPTQYLVSFSYEERSGVKTAEWLVDPSHSSFLPQSELAIALHKQ